MTTAYVSTDPAVLSFISGQNSGRGGSTLFNNGIASPTADNVIGFSSLTGSQAPINLGSGFNCVIVDGQHSASAAAAGAADNFSVTVEASGAIILTDVNSNASVTVSGVSALIFNGGATVNGTFTSMVTIGNAAQSMVADLYYGALGRQPDLVGLEYYGGALAAGASPSQIASDFLASAEFAARFGSGLSNSQFVGELYQDVLHRSGSAAELSYYSSALAGGTSRAQILLDFVTSPEEQQALAGKVVDTAGSVIAYQDGVSYINQQGVNSPTGDAVIANGAATQLVTVSGDSQFAIADAGATAVTVIATGGASDIALDFARARSVTLTGDAHLTLDAFGANYASLTSLTIANSGGVTASFYNAPLLTSINAGASSGTNILTLGAGQSYSGGSGQSVITLTADDSTVPLIGGSAANNELVLAGPKFTAAGTGAEAKGFSVAGFDFLSAAGSYDLSGDAGSILGGITTVDLQSTLPIATLFTVASKTALIIDDGGTSAIIYQAIDTTGATDSMALSLGGGSTTGALTLEDSATTPVGIGTVTVVSTGTGTVDSIGVLQDTALAALTVSGNDGLTISGLVDDTAASLSITNRSSGPGVLGTVAITTFTDNSLATLSFAGSNAIVITSLTDTITTALTISDSATANVAIHNFSTSAAPSLTVTNSGTALLTIGDQTGIAASALAALTLNGAVALTLDGDSVITGTTVSGAGDNANVTITLAGTQTGSTDTVTLGNGVDSVTTAGSGTETITLGNGGTAATPNKVTLTNSSAADNVTVGSGMNSVTLGNAGVEKISFGHHADSASFYDMITLTNVTASFSTATTTAQSSVATGSLDIVSGLIAGDHVLLPIATDGLVLATNLAGASGEAQLARGTYSASAGTFTYNAGGGDSLLTYDAVNGSTHPLVSVVLVGVTATSAAAIGYDGTITLG